MHELERVNAADLRGKGRVMLTHASPGRIGVGPPAGDFGHRTTIEPPCEG
jgi:hypothetical protein